MAVVVWWWRWWGTINKWWHAMTVNQVRWLPLLSHFHPAKSSDVNHLCKSRGIFFTSSWINDWPDFTIMTIGLYINNNHHWWHIHRAKFTPVTVPMPLWTLYTVCDNLPWPVWRRRWVGGGLHNILEVCELTESRSRWQSDGWWKRWPPGARPQPSSIATAAAGPRIANPYTADMQTNAGGAQCGHRNKWADRWNKV